MPSLETYFDDPDLIRRTGIVTAQLVVCYVVVVLSFTWGALGIPIALGVIFLAVLGLLKQVEGIVEDTVET